MEKEKDKIMAFAISRALLWLCVAASLGAASPALAKVPAIIVIPLKFTLGDNAKPYTGTLTWMAGTLSGTIKGPIGTCTVQPGSTDINNLLTMPCVGTAGKISYPHSSYTGSLDILSGRGHGIIIYGPGIAQYLVRTSFTTQKYTPPAG
jgi:hypothetical protein